MAPLKRADLGFAGDDAAARGWYCSFAGNVTYPSAQELRFAAAKVPEDRILVETDAPYLAPQPVRGRPNEPRHVVATAEAVAELRGVPYEGLERTVAYFSQPRFAARDAGEAPARFIAQVLPAAAERTSGRPGH